MKKLILATAALLLTCWSAAAFAQPVQPLTYNNVLPPVTCTAACDVEYYVPSNVASVRISGTNTGVAGTVDGTSSNPPIWTSMAMTPVGGGAAVSSFSANGFWTVPMAGLTKMRVHITSITGTNALVQVVGSAGAAAAGGSGGSSGGGGLSAQSTGGCTANYLITTGTLNATNVKNGQTTVCWFNVANNTGVLCYAKIYDKNGTPVPSTDSASMVQNYMDPASASGAGSNPPFGAYGLALTNGFGFAVTGGLAANDTTVAGIGCVVNYGYK